MNTKTKVETLLLQVSTAINTLRNAQKRFAPHLAPDFRLFDFLRTDEYGVSRCLALLLDPCGAHGQGFGIPRCLPDADFRP